MYVTEDEKKNIRHQRNRGKYKFMDTDVYSSNKKRKLETVKRNLEEELSKEVNEGPPLPGCRIDPNMNTQYCTTHMRKVHKRWIIQPEGYKPKIDNLELYMTPLNSPIMPKDDTELEIESEESENENKK